MQSGLARPVRGDVRLAAIGTAGPDVHHRAAPLPGRGLNIDHLPGHAPGEVRGALQVHREGAPPRRHPVVVAGLRERVPDPPRPADRLLDVQRGAVHQHLDPAQFAGGPGRDRGNRGRVAEVPGDDRVPLAGQARQHGLGALHGRPAVQHHPVSVRRERRRRGRADPARRSGDQDAPPGRHRGGRVAAASSARSRVTVNGSRNRNGSPGPACATGTYRPLASSYAVAEGAAAAGSSMRR